MGDHAGRRARLTQRVASPARSDGRTAHGFPIVGIGASAGGLEAFTSFLEGLPLDTGMGFVLVQHLDPEHESALTQLLARVTSLPVDEAAHALRVEPNHVYVIPPNTNLGIADGVLTLAPRPKTRTPHHSIDLFFEALASDQHERAIGVILSGTATDGTLGLEAIKAEGGITFAQDDSARYDSMPRNAVAAGCVDFVLSPEAMARELARIATHPAVAGLLSAPSVPEDNRDSSTTHEEAATRSSASGAPATHDRHDRERSRAEPSSESSDEQGYRTILGLLHNHSGVDFSLYKSTTIRRRIIRRMVLGHQDALDQYARVLRGNAKELDALYADALISVTSFFRNPEAFDALQRLVWPTLLERGYDPIRVWVLGCSTGQEAYSLAMSFVEAGDTATNIRQLQVFATDLHEPLLSSARYGLYSRTVTQDLSPERLRRFFVEEAGGYRVTKALREQVVFARQNVISDPPFSRIDLISCRNLLIYFEPGLQKRVFPTFHYALRPGGFLYLGGSESIGAFTELFEPIEKKHRIYVRKTGLTPGLHLRPRREAPSDSERTDGTSTAMRSHHMEAADPPRAVERDATREADRLTLQQFAPPGVLINADLQIVQFRGATGAYLAPAAGKATFDVLKMARPGLLSPLRAAIMKARRDDVAVRTEDVRVDDDAGGTLVHVEVIPLRNLTERCFLVVFENPASAKGRTSPLPMRVRRASRGAAARRLAELEAELAEARDYLQSIQEQHEAAREELQASNEEVQSANEELQSVNEELQTSKEELESANEELTTLNEELGNRNAELTSLNSDMLNVQTSAQLSIVLLDRHQTIRRFSAQAERQFALQASDVGRSFHRVRHGLHIPDLEPLIASVIQSVRPDEREVRDREGRWFALRVRPYVTVDNRVDGAVLVLVDIDAVKQSEEVTAAARDYADAIIRTARDPLVVLNGDLRVDTANAAFYRLFDVSPIESEGHDIYELGNGPWRIPQLRQLLEAILADDTVFDDFEVTHDFARLGRRTMTLNARRLNDGDGQPTRILLGIQDITALKGATEALRQSEERFRGLFSAIDQGFCLLERAGSAIEPFDFRHVEANPAFAVQSGVSDVVGRTLREAFPAEADEWLALYGAVLRTGQPTRFEQTLSSGRVLEVSAFRVGDGIARRVAVLVNDVTVRKANEEGRARLAAIVASSEDAIVSKDLNGIITSWNQGAERLFGYRADEAIGQSVTLLIPQDRLDEEPSVIARIRNGESVNQETVRRRKDGSLVHVSLSVSPILNDEGRIVGASKIARDVTERNRTEELLHAADRHKNEFLAMLAHELRNPLSPILVSIAILRRDQEREGPGSSRAERGGPGSAVDADADRQQRHDHALDVLQRQVGQMVRLVDDLLDAGRISQGKIELRRERVELSAVLGDTVEAARPMCDRADHQLSVTLPPAPVFLDADPARLTQIVGNLLNNACKFTPRGGRISLEAERDNRGDASAATPHVLIRVRDSGIGIAAHQRDSIFNIFTQLDTSLGRAVSGLGIGLTLVKRLTEMHGGTVEVRSPGVGHGSEFIIRLPIASDMEGAPPRSKDSESLEIPPLRILIVDDNRDATDTLAQLLTLAGHQTQTAHDGRTAVVDADSFRPDVILLDIGLPELDGYEAARRIRQAEKDGHRPLLVAVTGWGQDEDRKRARDVGFDAHVVKPVDAQSLDQLFRDFGLDRPR
jgi:two-component system, chemotaxis family, CheB/CheR fusion protein